MAFRHDLTATPAASDGDGIADANDSSGTSVTLDGVLTLNNVFTSSDNLGRQVVYTDAGGHDQSTATITLTGTNTDDEVITEDLTGPASTATVTSVKFYKSLTSVTISNPTASSTCDIGTAANTAVSQTYMCPDDHPTISIALTISGTCSVDIEHTCTDLDKSSNTQENANWFDHAVLAAQTASVNGNYLTPIKAYRLVFNSYNAGASVVMETMLANNGG